MSKEIRKTPFDGKKGLVIRKSHPHYGVASICMGAELTLSGWGMIFHDPSTGEKFFVFNGEDIQWL